MRFKTIKFGITAISLLYVIQAYAATPLEIDQRLLQSEMAQVISKTEIILNEYHGSFFSTERFKCVYDPNSGYTSVSEQYAVSFKFRVDCYGTISNGASTLPSGCMYYFDVPQGEDLKPQEVLKSARRKCSAGNQY